MVAKKKPVVKKVVVKKAPKKASVAKKAKPAVKAKTVVKIKPAAKTVTKKESESKGKPTGVKGEVFPKVLTGEGYRRRRLAALKNKK